MRCLFPLPAIYDLSGVSKLRFLPRSNPRDVCQNWESAYPPGLTGGICNEKLISVRCCKCTACKITKAEDWSIRCVHEAREHDHSMFVTLTYSPENAPNVLTREEMEEYDKRQAENEAIAKATGKKCVKEPPLRGMLDRPMTLYYPDFQDFMKRLRKYATTHYGSEYAKRISYLVCGEYTRSGIPHFHAIIFGLKMPDMFPVSKGKKVKNHNSRYKLYGSKTLENLWRHGFISIGEVNTHTASYVAQYTIKKLREGESECKTYNDHFYCYNKRTGLNIRNEYYADGRRKEFIRSSLKKPIGLRWVIKRSSIEDIYVRGDDKVIFVNAKGKMKRLQPPKFYDRVCEKYYPEIWEIVKAKRIQRLEESPPPTYEMFVSAFNVQQYRLSSKHESRNNI